MYPDSTDSTPSSSSYTASRNQKQPPARVATSCLSMDRGRSTNADWSREDPKSYSDPGGSSGFQDRVEPHRRALLPRRLGVHAGPAFPGAEKDAFGCAEVAVALDHRAHPRDEFRVLEDGEGDLRCALRVDRTEGARHVPVAGGAHAAE